MKNIIRVIVLLIPFYSSAQNYNALLIPDSLTKNADVVERYDETRIEIKDIGKAKLFEKHAYTILNESGDDYAGYRSRYDKFDEINYIEGSLYDASGKQIKNVKKKDIADESGTGDESLMSDDRYKVHNFYYRNYPYTVEYEEEDNLNGLFNLPRWFPQAGSSMGVEYSKFVVIVPKNLDIRYKQFNLPTPPVITESNDQKIYTWEVRNIHARTHEIYQPSWKEIIPAVFVAPTDFEIDGYKGNMNNWENYGKFISSLSLNRDILPDAVKQKVHELTNGITDPKEKIKVLYNFLQQNTRYISIQLGIGGWQPFDATYVATKRYGDCKALSNYMVALLKEAGIKANYALIRAGENEPDMISEFTCNQFNHATVCVPLDKDSVWLECTSQTVPAGYIGDFTGNRHALLVNETGGHVVTTKYYSIDDNLTERKINSSIDETGKLTGSIHTRYHCMEQDDLHGEISYFSKEKLLERRKKDLDLPDYDITSLNYNEAKSEKPYIDENIDIVANNYASVSGKRLFVMPNILSKDNVKLTANEQRKYPIARTYAFTTTDSVHIDIPAGYSIEAMPKDLTINNKFGSYEVHFKVTENKIDYTRLYKEKEGTFPVSDYAELVQFYNDMYKADRSRIVFVKKEG